MTKDFKISTSILMYHTIDNVCNEIIFVTDSKHLHNVLHKLHPVQQYFNLKNLFFYAHPANNMGSHNNHTNCTFYWKILA
jgi:hypothetical protein